MGAEKHERAVSATDNGRLRKEIVGVTIPQRKGEDLVVEEDEAPRRNAGIEQMRKLSSIFPRMERSLPGMRLE